MSRHEQGYTLGTRHSMDLDALGVRHVVEFTESATIPLPLDIDSIVTFIIATEPYLQ
jgi:hypothetical protein